MTGGAGFVGMGRSSNKNNLGMIGNRKKMDDNPYRGAKKTLRTATNYHELKAWKKKKRSRRKSARNIIFLSLLLLALLVFIFTFINS